MNQTWPYLNPLSEPLYPKPFLQVTSPHVDSTSDHVINMVRSTYQIEAKDCEVEIWYASPQPGLVPLAHLPSQNFRLVQAEPCLPYYERETDLSLATGPEEADEDSVEPVLYGIHTHSLIFTHPLTLEIVRELRTLDVLSFQEPCVLYIVLTYKCGDAPVFRSRFLANYVRSDSLKQSAGVLTKETVFQCFLAELLLPVEGSSLRPDPSSDFSDLMLQAALYQEALEEELSEDFDFEEETDEDEDE